MDNKKTRSQCFAPDLDDEVLIRRDRKDENEFHLGVLLPVDFLVTKAIPTVAVLIVLAIGGGLLIHFGR